MSEEIPQELIDTGLEWHCHAKHYYRSGETHQATKLRDGWAVSIGSDAHDVQRFASFAEAVRPTVAEALAVARRMIEAANG